MKNSTAKLNMGGLLAVVLFLFTTLVVASESEGMKEVDINVHDQAALQRGARIFVDNCLSCHAASYMRYNRLAEDLGLSKDQVIRNFMPKGAKFGDTMTVSMTADESTTWFGNDAPDLSVIGRSRGGSWLYAYLTSFYQDDMGHWNNTVFKDVAMPHVLWHLQGIQTAVFHEEEDASGSKHKIFSHFELKTPGTESPEEYAKTVKDLVSYLVYMGEPAKLKRESIGIWVLLFIALFTFVAYLLKVEYWKDVH